MDTEQAAGERTAVEEVDGAALDRAAPDEPERLTLAAGFPAADRAAWVALVDRAARRAGRIPDDAPAGAGVAALTWTDHDGIAVAPLHTAADTAADTAALPAAGAPRPRPAARDARAAASDDGGGRTAGWDVRAYHADPDPAAVRAAVLTDLRHGATSIWLAVGAGATAARDLPAALDGVHLDLAPVVLDAAGSADPDDADRAAVAYLDLAGAAADPARVAGGLGLDPVGRRARTGTGADPAAVVPLALRAGRELPRATAVVVDALPVHVAGGSPGQELGYALAAGVAYLRALTGAGLDVDAAARLLEFRLAATADQFTTIAALRAARRLWARVLQVSGAAPGAAAVHAVASPTMYTRRSPYTNLVRGTVAAVAAGVGGADAVTVLPFDAALGASTPFSRRIARNTQSVLVHEAHLARVADPAGGSWYVGTRTDALARAGWAFFRRIERAGGVVAALDAGLVADEVARVRAAREDDAAAGRAPVVGVTAFPDPQEEPVPRTGPDVLTRLGYGTGGLPVHRPAAAADTPGAGR